MKRQKMRTEQKSNVKNSVGRLVFVGLSLLLQVLWILLLFLRLNAYSTAISLCFSVGAFLVALSIYAKHENAAFKMPWIILILAFPVLGLCIYLVFGHKNVVAKAMRRRFETIEPVLFEQIPQDEAVLERLEEQDFAVANQCRYIKRFGHYPVYRNTDVTFYPDAAEGLAAQLHDLASAEHFIFMEYHAIEEAEAFGRIKDVLAERAAHGVEVRLFYDDVGSIGFIDPGFIKRMEAIGVECRVFNPVLPILNIFMNNRDHRKILVIDGHTAYTGGVNLADEYINRKVRFGHWKDNAIRLKGDAVNNFTVMFLQMWDVCVKKLDSDFDYSRYLDTGDYFHAPELNMDGFSIPFSDSPIDGEPVGHQLYLDIIYQARKYVYIMTPYLVLDDDMITALTYAAKRGVDTVIIMPHIPDKKSAFMLAHSYYTELIEAGVKVYEYLPGFVHSKTFVSDGEKAVVGSVNMDFRSQYLNFECGVYIYENPVVKDIRYDFDETLKKCVRMTKESVDALPTLHKFCGKAMRLIAPLM